MAVKEGLLREGAAIEEGDSDALPGADAQLMLISPCQQWAQWGHQAGLVPVPFGGESDWGKRK